jgi:hypothetical protein
MEVNNPTAGSTYGSSSIRGPLNATSFATYFPAVLFMSPNRLEISTLSCSLVWRLDLVRVCMSLTKGTQIFYRDAIYFAESRYHKERPLVVIEGVARGR